MEHRLSGTLSKLLSHDKERLPQIPTMFEPPEFIEDLPPDEYHNDRTRMSSSGIKKLLHSPRQFLKFWSGYEEDEDKDHFRIGRASHMMLLEPKRFRELYLIQPEFGPMQSKTNRAARDEWRAAQDKQALILSSNELDDIVGMIESVLEHPVASEMLRAGKPECTMKWTDPETGIRCKSRPDYLVNDRNGDLHLIDFKTTRDIREGIFANDAGRLKYYTQLAFYHDGVVETLKKQPKAITLIAVEKGSPYEAAVDVLHDDWYEEGRKEYQHALKIYKKCIETGKWPAYQTSARLLMMPNKFKDQPLPEFDWS